MSSRDNVYASYACQGHLIMARLISQLQSSFCSTNLCLFLHLSVVSSRFQKLYQALWDTYSDALAKAAAQQTLSGPNRQPPAELTLVHNCYTAQLLQPDMTADAVQFAVLEIVWLADLLLTAKSSSSSSSGVLGSVPESVLADAASWLTFVIQQGQSEQLAAVPIGM